MRFGSCWKLGLAWVLMGHTVLFAQGSSENATQPAQGSGESTGELPPPKLPVKKEYSKAEIQTECRKYEGKLISFYDQIFQVKACKRHEIVQDDTRQGIVKGQNIEVVKAETISKIPLGDSLGTSGPSINLSCNKIEGHYLMTRGDEVYFVEKCKRRLFPDWDTYAEHATKKGKKGQAILEVSETDLAKIKAGEDYKSILDDEYRKLLDADKGIDLIPLEEACKGLNGKFVAYYSRIYRIEKCKKRPVDAEQFGVKNPRYKLEELSGEQWISLPNGQEFKL
jgi:hypothetical protein